MQAVVYRIEQHCFVKEHSKMKEAHWNRLAIGRNRTAVQNTHQVYCHRRKSKLTIANLQRNLHQPTTSASASHTPSQCMPLSSPEEKHRSTPQARSLDLEHSDHKHDDNRSRLAVYLFRHEALAHPPHHGFYRLPRWVGLGQRHQQRSDPRVFPSPPPPPLLLPTPTVTRSLLTPNAPLMSTKRVRIGTDGGIVGAITRRLAGVVRCSAAPGPPSGKQNHGEQIQQRAASVGLACLPAWRRGFQVLAVASEELRRSSEGSTRKLRTIHGKP